ncbi:hypothetical protein GCM10010517_22590 [Streptosporangium fragile]|uniref:Uncharacterized protein n=1 Tax=Streptosporangium fragile TaxID=46186 RepID=A0ABP6IDK6_9ACTN
MTTRRDRGTGGTSQDATASGQGRITQIAGDQTVHHHHYPGGGSVAMARAVLDSVGEIRASPRTAGPDVLERLLSDLEAVHRDYLVMFETLLERTPDAWEEGTPHYTESVREVAALLRRLRLEYEPVRVRVHAAAKAYGDALTAVPQRTFIGAVLAYFPTGELRGDEADGRWRTSGTTVLDHLYRSLDGELGQELGALIRSTLAFHRQRWSEVCDSYAALQIGQA